MSRYQFWISISINIDFVVTYFSIIDTTRYWVHLSEPIQEFHVHTLRFIIHFLIAKMHARINVYTINE